ncbi:aminotransferase class III-fold pyridoxal phosphate-dependent enzyme [Luteitalea sp.]|jgi:glutamate-1-semialdehyde 2,1-aminomutase|uniref:aminotransferase class III-fold pyridoxal phosphate-dependent enzyme n=1 Tax=Luteitalea sp. TaxID=2004800 RepID=UPI0037C9CDE5
MTSEWVALASVGLPASVWAARAGRRRLQLSRAKHPSLQGHVRLARRIARLLPGYSYDEAMFFGADGAPPDIVMARREGFGRLAALLAQRSPRSIAATTRLEPMVSDLQFIKAYQVPFQYARYLRSHLQVGRVLQASSGVFLEDLDGHRYYDVAGSYGVNVFGHDFYKRCIEDGVARARDLGPVLGAYHPVVEANVERLRRISGLDEVSFHMSGTEAVMQAVRLARYHTGRSHVVQFVGAYHGWWDGVQPGVGNPRAVGDVYVLGDMSERTLRVLETRDDIACVLVNPIQALHPNSGAPSDGTLIAGDRRATPQRDRYEAWLADLRAVCTRRGIVLIFDEVFVGFRLALGGAQEYFGVGADLVTYGKSLGGGLPVGVLCGKAALMKRFREDRPSDICFARGTFNAHPYVMATMDAFLSHLESPAVAEAYRHEEARWDGYALECNRRFEGAGLPIRVGNLSSIWTIGHTAPSRYNWMLQFYLRAHGLALSWIGTGRLIFSHDYTSDDVAAVADRILAAGAQMAQDGWWWHPAEATTKSVRASVLREVLRVRLGRGPA